VAQPLIIFEFLNFCGLPGEMSHVCMAVGVHFVKSYRNNQQDATV